MKPAENEQVMPELMPNPGDSHGGEGGVPGGGLAGGGGGRPVGTDEILDKGDRAGLAHFAHSEIALAEVSGISKKDLARTRARHLRQGVHWDLRGSEVAYSATGMIEVLQRVSGMTATKGKICGVEVLDLQRRTRIGGTEGELVKARVSRLYVNRFLIQALLPDGRRVNVRVRESKNFRRGMELPLMWNGRAYELQGRTPRSPGRW